MRQREVDGAIELPKHPEFKAGDSVRVIVGPFAGRLGIFSNMKPRQRVEVLLQVLGAAQKVTLPKDAVEVI